MITISICMIVKNEEKHLERCLNSIADLAEELIIVDTGSTDRTKEIAEKYSAKIYDFEWMEDFAAARNFSFSKATMDYIYQADADEVLDETNRIRFNHLKQMLSAEVDVVQMYYCNELESNNLYNEKKTYLPKMYKRIRKFYFEDPIHEHVRLEPLIYDSDIEIQHLPEEIHSKRDFKGFKRMIDTGMRLSHRLHNMYAAELFISGEAKDFLDSKEFFIESINDIDRSTVEKKEAAAVLVKIALIEKDIVNILKYVLKDTVNNMSSEMCYLIGEFFYEQGDYNEASLWYYNSVYKYKSILHMKIKDIYAKEQLADCYEKTGKHSEAKKIRDEIEK